MASSSGTSRMNRRALYNCLRLQAEEPGIEPWQVEDYRRWSIERLFQVLRSLGWKLDRAAFCAYAESVEGPEELLELLLAEQELSAKEEDQLYLVVFELWRRLAPSRGNLEQLCDELDYQIFAYEQGEQVDQAIELVLSQLTNLIEEQTEDLKQAKKAFELIQSQCAHDIELFLYDFILDQLEAGAHVYAQELYRRFAKLVQQPLWFELLRVRWSDSEEAAALLRQIYSAECKRPNIDLLFEVVAYLSEHEVSGQFEPFFELLADQQLSVEESQELKQLAHSYLSHHQGKLRRGLLELLEQRC